MNEGLISDRPKSNGETVVRFEAVEGMRHHPLGIESSSLLHQADTAWIAIVNLVEKAREGNDEPLRKFTKYWQPILMLAKPLDVLPAQSENIWGHTTQTTVDALLVVDFLLPRTDDASKKHRHWTLRRNVLYEP